MMRFDKLVLANLSVMVWAAVLTGRFVEAVTLIIFGATLLVIMTIEHHDTTDH